MMLSPPRLDLWIAGELAAFLKYSPSFGNGVASAIDHNLLGGLWFGAALFVFWTYSQRGDQAQSRVRMMTIVGASALAILLALLAGAVISWPPPSRYPGLENLYRGYWEPNQNTNCFPSQSTAFYSSVAAGIYSVHKSSGRILWFLVAICVALPRMYVGGHFFTDVVAGLLIGLVSFAATRHFEPAFATRISRFLERSPWIHGLWEFFVFLWIIQATVEFKDASWAVRSIQSVIK